MQLLRTSTLLARLVLAWFVLSLGVAVASVWLWQMLKVSHAI